MLVKENVLPSDDNVLIDSYEYAKQLLKKLGVEYTFFFQRKEIGIQE